MGRITDRPQIASMNMVVAYCTQTRTEIACHRVKPDERCFRETHQQPICCPHSPDLRKNLIEICRRPLGRDMTARPCGAWAGSCGEVGVGRYDERAILPRSQF